MEDLPKCYIITDNLDERVELNRNKKTRSHRINGKLKAGFHYLSQRERILFMPTSIDPIDLSPLNLTPNRTGSFQLPL